MDLQYSKEVLEKAKKIAIECQGHREAYCSVSCPMRTDAMNYVQLIQENKIKEALLRIRETLFLPGTLGRVCVHPCEVACKRNKEYNEPIAIATLKRYAADKADHESLWDISKKTSTGKNIAIIGAGPAGAQAAIDLAKEGHAVTIYEKLPFVGGMLRVGIPSYRLPRNIIDFEYSYLEKLGIVFKMGVEIEKDISFEQLRVDYDAVVVAIGAHKGSLVSTKGDNCASITNAADFLRTVSLEGKVNLPCKHVIVIGGGDVAIDCARTALRLGAKSVKIVYRRTQAEMPASKHEQKGAMEEGILFYCGYTVLELTSEQGLLKGMVCNKSATAPNDKGEHVLQHSDKTMMFDCDTLIFATGQLVQDMTNGALEQGKGGKYISDPKTLATNLEGVFVAGDCAGSTIVVAAMALGRKAALSVIRYLENQPLDMNRDFSKEFSCVPTLDIPLPDDVQDLPRNTTREKNMYERIHSFTEYDLGFDDESALQESSRCLRCECKKCMQECLMLREFTTHPGDLFAQFIETGEMDPLLVYSCNMCDQCTLVCPENYPFVEIFGGIRQGMVKAHKGNSPLKGHKAINMHQMLGFSKLFTTRCKGVQK